MVRLYQIIILAVSILSIDISIWAVPPCSSGGNMTQSCIIPHPNGFTSNAIINTNGVALQTLGNTALVSSPGTTITSISSDISALKLEFGTISLNSQVGTRSNPFNIWFLSSFAITAPLTETIYANNVCIGVANPTSSNCGSNSGVEATLLQLISSGILSAQNDIVLGSNATIEFDGGSLSTPNIQGIGQGYGTLNMNANATLPAIGTSFSNAIQSLQVNSSTTTLSGNIYISYNTVGNGALNIAAGSTLVTCPSCIINANSASQLTNDGTWQFQVVNSNSFGTINTLGNLNGNGAISINPTSTIRENMTLENFIQTGVAWDPTSMTLTSTQSNLGLKLVDTSANSTAFNLLINVLNDWPTALQNKNLSVNQQSVIDALAAVAAVDTVVYDILLSSVDTGNIQSFVDSIAGTPQPTNIIANQVPSVTTNIISNRIAMVQNDFVSQSGISSGDSINNMNRNAWVQPFVSQAHQGTKNMISGYTSNTGGTAIGFDTMINDINLGIAFTYADTHIRGRAFGSPKSHINTLQGTLYSGYNIFNWHLEAMGYYGRNSYKTHIDLQNIGRRSGKYKGYQFGGKLGLAYKLYSGELEIVPRTTVDYGNIHTNAYTETGVGSLNRTLSKARYETSTADALINFAKPMKIKAGGTFVPSINLGAGYDIKSNTVVNTASFIGAPSVSYNLQGIKPARTSLKGGINLTYKFYNAMSLVADYMCEKKSKYINNSAYLNFNLAF